MVDLDYESKFDIINPPIRSIQSLKDKISRTFNVNLKSASYNYKNMSSVEYGEDMILSKAIDEVGTCGHCLFVRC